MNPSKPVDNRFKQIHEQLFTQLFNHLPKTTVKDPMTALLHFGEHVLHVTVESKTRLVGNKYVTDVYFIDRMVETKRLMGTAEDKSKDQSKTLAATNGLENLHTNPKLLYPFVYLKMEHLGIRL